MHVPPWQRVLEQVSAFLVRHRVWVLAGVLGAALIMRVPVCLREHPDTSLQQLDDGIEYLAQARSILNGKLDGHPRNYQYIRSPGYALFLLPFEWLTPQEGREWTPSAKFNLDPPVRISTGMFRSIQLVQCFLSVATALLVGRIAQRMAGPIAGIVATALAAWNPYIVSFSGFILSETLFLFLVWLSLHELLRYADQPNSNRWRPLVSASLVLTAGCLVRPNLQASLPIAAIWVGWIEWRRLRQWLPALGAMTLMTVLVSAFLLPLMLRNKRVHGEFNLSPFYATAIFGQGHSPYYLKALTAPNNEEYLQNLQTLFQQSRLDSPIQKSAWLDEPRRFFQESRGEWWQLQWLKTKSFWRPWLNPTVFSRAKVLLSAVAVVPIFIGAFCSFLVPAIRRHPLFPLLWAMAMVSYLIGGVAFTASTRFRIPFLDVSFMVLTAAVLETLLHRIVPGTQATTPHETASPNR
jgi:hypothetical protein